MCKTNVHALIISHTNSRTVNRTFSSILNCRSRQYVARVLYCSPDKAFKIYLRLVELILWVAITPGTSSGAEIAVCSKEIYGTDFDVLSGIRHDGR
jgi:hypothetical protein